MSMIALRDILIKARQESTELKHFYIGVEHLFLALLRIQGGLASNLLESLGLATPYVIEAIQRKCDKGIEQRLWVGIPDTPRTEVVVGLAKKLARQRNAGDVTERELFIAIMNEGHNLPARVLKSLNVDTRQLAEMAEGYSQNTAPIAPDINITFGADFGDPESIAREQLFLLRRMFDTHGGIRIERRLTGFGSALVLVVTPIRADGREDAFVVAKIDQADRVLDEAQRYEMFVRHALPLQTARLEDKPTAPEHSDLAGVRYTLVSAGSEGIPQDLRTWVRDFGATMLGKQLRQNLYNHFNKTWWQQKRPYRFQAWKEYDWMLPPLLVLDAVAEEDVPSHPHVVRVPFNRVRLKERLEDILFGDYVILENFTVQRVDRARNLLKLTVGFGAEAEKQAYMIEVRGVDVRHQTFTRGLPVDKLCGRVVKRRHDALVEAVEKLEPDFDLQSKWIPFGTYQVPNLLHLYEQLLDRYLNGSMSRIHGDFHLGNIVIGPNGTAWLIDFSHVRDGHTLFDWANLEISVLGDVVMPMAGNDWETARQILIYLVAMSQKVPVPITNSDIYPALAAVSAVREIAGECLTQAGNWHEYYLTICFCALRALTWETMSLGARRLMLLLGGLAALELQRPAPDGSDGSASPEDTEVSG